MKKLEVIVRNQYPFYLSQKKKREKSLREKKRADNMLRASSNQKAAVGNSPSLKLAREREKERKKNIPDCYSANHFALEFRLCSIPFFSIIFFSVATTRGSYSLILLVVVPLHPRDAALLYAEIKTPQRCPAASEK